MNKDKYNAIINSNLTIIGKVLIWFLILLIISLPIIIFPLTELLLWNILISITIIVTFITVIGFTIFTVCKYIVWYNNRKGYHELSVDIICLSVLTTTLATLAFIIKFFCGDWR